MTLRELERVLDRLEHDLTDLSPQARESFRAFIGTVLQEIMDLNTLLLFYQTEAGRKLERYPSCWYRSES